MTAREMGLIFCFYITLKKYLKHVLSVLLPYTNNHKYHKGVTQSLTGAKKQHYYGWEVFGTSGKTFPLELP